MPRSKWHDFKVKCTKICKEQWGKKCKNHEKKVKITTKIAKSHQKTFELIPILAPNKRQIKINQRFLHYHWSTMAKVIDIFKRKWWNTKNDSCPYLECRRYLKRYGEISVFGEFCVHSKWFTHAIYIAKLVANDCFIILIGLSVRYYPFPYAVDTNDIRPTLFEYIIIL